VKTKNMLWLNDCKKGMDCHVQRLQSLKGCNAHKVAVIARSRLGRSQ